MEPLHQPPQFRVLSDQQTERVYQAALECLNRTGVNVLNAQARDLLAAAGARVDGVRVRIPPRIAIDEVGPHGDFLGTKHTKRHFREDWYPQLFDRNNFEGWVAAGSKTLSQRARERVDEILAGHQPEPLPPQIQARIDEVLNRCAG